MPLLSDKIPAYVFSEAVKHYWSTLDRQGEQANTDTGKRTKVTGGKQMGGFEKQIKALLIKEGLNSNEIFSKSSQELPGFFRPEKRWDIIAVKNSKLLAAIELKSQAGPSFGNNFNNRTEEALGLATDFWTSLREKTFSHQDENTIRPWTGYLFLLEDCKEVHQSRGVKEPHFKVRPEFVESSYAKRYELMCRRLMLERHFDATCLLLSDLKLANQNENYTEPAKDLSANQFLANLLSHIARLLEIV